MAARETNKERREAYSSSVLAAMDGARDEYKQRIQEVMGDRSKYREMISTRKDKEKALLDILALDKIDLPTLQKAIDEAKDNLVVKEVVNKAEVQLDWLKYCKEVEAQLQAAVAEKVKENILAVLEKIEKEAILIEPKMLNDAKNVVAKLK